MSKIKKLFETPKKAILTSVGIIAALAVIGTGTVLAAGAAAESNAIGKENAEQVALADAGVDPSSTFVSRTEFEREHGQYVYEVEFTANGIEYDYLINASDGTVITRNTEGNTVDTIHQNTPETTPTETETAITAERAKEIALQHASLTSADVTFIHTKLDVDDGVQVYDVEFYQGNTEYDYEINAATGSIISYDHDAENHKPAKPQTSESQNGNSTPYIGVDKAKSIAVTHAGLSLSNVAFVKAKLENDDGRSAYEIEFYADGIEYEYSIDAASGKILEYDSEYED